jgi:hypothetical protein
MERTMKKFLAIAAVTVGLSAAATTVANAQNYLVNGHAASKAEAQFLASYSAPAGQWQSDGYGISRVADVQPVVKTTGPKCWYVLDVQLCE